MKLIVLGAGINGTTCALKIKEKYPDYDVTLLGAQFSPNTTGDGSGGLWYPYLCGKTPEALIGKWGIETYSLLLKLWRQGGYGISLQPVYVMYRDGTQSAPKWANDVFGYMELDQKQLEYFNKLFSVQYVAGNTFNTFVVNPSTLLKRLEQQLDALKVTRRQGSVKSLTDPILRDYDVIINCTGLGAREVVPDDKVHPIRGQILKVNAPWVFYSIQDKCSGHYIIPNDTFCVLGGTGQANNYSTEVNNDDTDFIEKGCHNLIPSLKGAKLQKYFVGLRPARDEVRVEVERVNGKLCIHNYGHGGSGFTLFWGCGITVLELFEKHVTINNTSKL
ncbi:D-amino-acid oxidase [Pieris rapae]|uniref:D-amino-acid oxidase n=1 Tax=Pieris rapae TaxID=64459 RepID=UPI001E27B103|nr:D-amino-acid oxidase [Pieris rapae]